MRIACPNCDAAYDVPSERLAPGRAVRCARCSELWTPIAANAPAAIEAAPEPPPEPWPEPSAPLAPAEPVPLPEDRPPVRPAVVTGAATGRSLRERAPLSAAWLLSVAILAGLGWLAVARRAEVMQAWPASERIYAALGLVTRTP